MKKLPGIGQAVLLLSFLFVMLSCSKTNLSESEKNRGRNPMSLPMMVFYALAEGNVLDKLNTENPETPLNSVVISGLQTGENILAIDFRPATGQLYGLGSSSRIYVINPATGAARAIGSGAFTPVLAGSIAGFDFNPTVDRIRVVTSTGQNLRINPETGAVAFTDGSINGQDGAMVAASAYTNNFAGAATTMLFNIDVASDKLFLQTPPNEGTLQPVGDLMLKVEGNGGFDIAPDGTPLALFEVNKKATLFTVDLATGRARILHKFNKDTRYTGIALPTNPVAYAIRESDNQLLIFNPEAPATVVPKAITGLQMGEKILGIDFRPANGQLYALGSSSRLYTINVSNGAAMAVGSAVFATPLMGTHFGFDFNPTVDRIRVVSDAGQNLRLHPDLGTVVFTDDMLNPGTPMVTAAAYTNNFAGATTTTLFDIDTNTDKLLIQAPPNDGVLTEVGSLGINATAANGFDIGGTSGIAYAILTTENGTRIYSINTSTGVAKSMSNFPATVNGFAIGLGF